MMTDNKQQVNNQLQVFNNEAFGQVRSIWLDEQPYFIGRDVAEILGYTNPNKAIQDHVDEEDKFLRSERGNEMLKLFSSLKDLQDQLGRQDNWLINESGLYSLIMSSKLPSAKAFKRWITSEVLPAIRKHGGYLTPEKVEEALLNPDVLIKLASQLKLERAKRLEVESKLAVAQPKADYYNEFMNREETFTVSDVAASLGMTYQAVYKRLTAAGWLYKPAGCKHQITPQAPDGVFKIVQCLFKGKSRGEQIRVTAKGFKEVQKLLEN